MRLGGVPVPLSPVLEPIADLGEGESGDLGEVPLGGRRWVSVVFVELFEGVAALLLEAVDGLLSVPYSTGKGELPAEPVFVYSPQRSPPGPLRLVVSRLVPEILEGGVVAGLEVVTL